jgi:hypothetical protein
MERQMRQVEDTTELTLRSPGSLQEFDTLRAQRDKIFHQSLSKGRHEKKSASNKKSKPQEAVLTSSAELTGRWVSREVPVTVAFFRRLEARELPFLIVASGDFTTTAAS